MPLEWDTSPIPVFGVEENKMTRVEAHVGPFQAEYFTASSARGQRDDNHGIQQTAPAISAGVEKSLSFGLIEISNSATRFWQLLESGNWGNFDPSPLLDGYGEGMTQGGYIAIGATRTQRRVFVNVPLQQLVPRRCDDIRRDIS